MNFIIFNLNTNPTIIANNSPSVSFYRRIVVSVKLVCKPVVILSEISGYIRYDAENHGVSQGRSYLYARAYL